MKAVGAAKMVLYPNFVIYVASMHCPCLSPLSNSLLKHADLKLHYHVKPYLGEFWSVWVALDINFYQNVFYCVQCSGRESGWAQIVPQSFLLVYFAVHLCQLVSVIISVNFCPFGGLLMPISISMCFLTQFGSIHSTKFYLLDYFDTSSFVIVLQSYPSEVLSILSALHVNIYQHVFSDII
jgi:hypothetical protein